MPRPPKRRKTLLPGVVLAVALAAASCATAHPPTRADLVNAFQKPTSTGRHLTPVQAGCWADVTLRMLNDDELNQVVIDGGAQLPPARKAAWGQALQGCL